MDTEQKYSLPNGTPWASARVRMKDIFSNIDWPLFEKQKAAFVETIYGTPMSPEHQELLEGLLYAIDHFQDCAEDAGFDAFPTLNKED